MGEAMGEAIGRDGKIHKMIRGSLLAVEFRFNGLM